MRETSIKKLWKKLKKVGNEIYFQKEIEIDENKKRYVYVSNYLKNGCHIRAFYDNNERTYILYLKTMKIFKITNECFNQLIKNLEHRPSGRPCEECYVWKN